jgi:adenosylcobyric acid synthase
MRPIMIQATSSDAGKTTIVAGLCRLFANRGYKVAPFKSQNMALNSYVTENGEEIARATAVQAFGARQQPIVHMNPLLLKPKADDLSQLIVHGKALMDVTAKEYFLSGALQGLKLGAIRESISYLRQHYDLIIAEGAGSCAEPNLRELDVVNMGLAHELRARVFVVTDIDKGGAFADILGSLKVMEIVKPDDIDLIAGFIINKFRGDLDVLRPGVDFIERHTGFPVLGVLPFISDLRLEEEDRVKKYLCEHPEVDIVVIYLPHISNANDFDFLACEQNVRVRFVKSADSLGVPDAVIIPGTKNTVWDLDYMRRVGLERAIKELASSTPIVGICGGYQMLGHALRDEGRLESALGTIEGMGLLDITVEFLPNKIVTNRKYRLADAGIFGPVSTLSGYEIHSGLVRYGNCEPMFVYEGGCDGAIHPERLIFGTFIHDVFSNRAFTRAFVNNLRQKKGLPALTVEVPGPRDRAEDSYERLASVLEQCASF